MLIRHCKTLFCAALLSISMLALPASAQKAAPTQKAAVATLPEGEYFIVSVATGEALQVVQPMVGQNVFLKNFDRGGLQRWKVVRVRDNKTKKLTPRFTIQLAGPATMYLEPYPVPNNHTAIVSSMRSASYSLRAAGDGAYELRSHQLNGDAMHAFPFPPVDTEARFGPSNGSESFAWKFIPAQ